MRIESGKKTIAWWQMLPLPSRNFYGGLPASLSPFGARLDGEKSSYFLHVLSASRKSLRTSTRRLEQKWMYYANER